MAAKDSTVTIKVTEVSRRRSSRNGNPSWQISGTSGCDFWSFATQSDAACAYSITDTNLIGETVTLTLTPAGRVRYYKIVDESYYPEVMRRAASGELREYSEDW